MKIKTSELTGLALDWAIAECEEVGLWDNEPANQYLYSSAFGNRWSPSQAHAGGWGISGPIIEREHIDIDYMPRGVWRGKCDVFYAYGESPLIAALRAYAESKLGAEITIPDILLSDN